MTDQGAEGLLSPYLQAKRISAVRPYLKGIILDCGCGCGVLATLIDSDKYVGGERDDISLQQAKLRHPNHFFVAKLPEPSNKFDTVVALAVIEHVDEPVEYLRTLAGYLDDARSARLVITTPHPAVDWVHDLGAAIGLFSEHANDERADLLGHLKLEIFGKNSWFDNGSL